MTKPATGALRLIGVSTLALGIACGGGGENTSEGPTTSAPPVPGPATTPEPVPAGTKAAIAGTLCFEGEEALLTCGTRSDRLLSLCSQGAVLRYRYGKPGAVELEYPEKDQPLVDAFKWESAETQGSMDGAPGGQFSKLSFKREGTGYLIDERYVGEPPVIKIVVTPPTGDTVTIDCDQHIDGNLSFVAVNMSLPVDQGL